jgi:quinoprotein glucose dehydrogenase
MRHRAAVLLILAASTVLLTGAQAPQSRERAGDWPSYRHDAAGTGYSSLDEINTRNVSRLAPRWTFRLEQGSAPATGGPGNALSSQATPIVVSGVMYVPAAGRVVALDPEKGTEIWAAAVSGAGPSRRGVAYWAGEGATAARIFVTSGRRLVALDAKTGNGISSFGTNGEVDLGIPYNSVPGVFGNIVVVGANSPPGAIGGVGDPRAFDARTGQKVWEFHAVPRPGDPGFEARTWEGESWQGRLGANAWPFYFTADTERGVMYVPLASPIPGAYGGDRKGANLFGNSVVAIDIKTGAYKWHFQTIHHDLWDHDPPAPPALFEIVRGRERIPALALTTKSGYLYVLNRENGRPVFGVEERAVPTSDVPGEAASPTQPIPVKPPALARVSYAPTDLVTATDTTAEHAQACADLVKQAGSVVNAGAFTPYVFRPEGAPVKSTLLFPGGLGGANWGGAAYDPGTGNILVATQDVGALGFIQKARAGFPVPYDRGNPGRGTFDARVGEQNWPCQKPPWGRLTAINSSSGDIAWQVPLGVTDQLPPDKQRTGRPLLAGAIVTAGGVIFIASTDDNRFRALDAKTGRELWETTLARRGNADPMTYRGASGKQYVAIVATDTLSVFALP